LPVDYGSEWRHTLFDRDTDKEAIAIARYVPPFPARWNKLCGTSGRNAPVVLTATDISVPSGAL
jgi:hypothetical protein